ncbi:hypothetical protein PF005_g27519 [Phytophthora fragariae]|uniref:Uncharacterized protein n=2 Tax=Phytophthora TaxID=4783 RepID=A0A6A3Q4I0_9STRA|nr:hypothetical protein PF003_g24752 [Phytophthora fragariae]KAE8974989.1 hypothetical protein PR002_g25737 [Phytophthora rubi]KAE8970125.1 hypothetical protein PF011_g26537 [Phytophthora fragariae]KAE9068985.1 hypothetical protein PF007_g27488 [Phytophthora fragariae]KAE9082643.1 hypothetical protein PF006_g26863 [Phytophthora fragariae]
MAAPKGLVATVSTGFSILSVDTPPHNEHHRQPSGSGASDEDGK